MEDINNNKYYLGVDLHRDSFTIYGTDYKGNELIKGKYPNHYQSVKEVIDYFPNKPEVVVEATRNWMWFVNYLKIEGCQVTLAHPLKTKAIASAKIKTDSLDAKTLCHLLRSNMIPSSYIAEDDEWEAREISRARIQFVSDQTKIKNRVMAILGKENLRFTGSDLFTVKGREWLKRQSITPARKLVLEMLLQGLDEVKRAIKKIDTIIKEKGGNSPEVSYLMSIPSIGAITAFIILAEIGRIERFPTADKLTAYLGLVPRLNQSANHTYYGRITKAGNSYVRWALVQAAHRYARIDKQANRFVYRISKKGGKKKAIVALARKLAVIIYHVLKEKRPYIKNYQGSFKKA